MRAHLCDGAGATIHLPDENLMQGIQEKDPVALAALFDRYASVLKALAMRIIHNEAEAEDLLMEIYMEIWRQAPHYNAQKGKPLGWLVTMTRRRSIDRLRKRQSYLRAEERFQHETEATLPAPVHNSVDTEIDIRDVHDVLASVIASLPPAQQQAIDLAYYRGMSQREIAMHTGIPLGTVKTRLELGLKKISEALKGIRHEF